MSKIFFENLWKEKAKITFSQSFWYVFKPVHHFESAHLICALSTPKGNVHVFILFVDKSKESLLVLAGFLMSMMLYGYSKICSTQKKTKKCK